MRVALISYHTSPLANLGSSAAGGMNLYIRRLAEGLAAAGCRVDVFTRRDSRRFPDMLEFTPGARLLTVRAGPERVVPKEELAGHTMAFARNIAAFASDNKLRYDVIHSHYWLSGIAASALRFRDEPLIHMFHTLQRVKQLYQPSATGADPASRDLAEMRLLRSKLSLVFSTEAEVDDVERVYGFRPDSFSIIPPGVDHDRFQPQDGPTAKARLGLAGRKVVLCVGRMDRAKGVDALLDAITGLRERGELSPAMRLVIVGGSDHRRDGVAADEVARLRGIVRSRDLGRFADFRGVVPQEELPLYYAAADVCAVPSSYESFGMVALEALSCGRPVVGFRSRGLEQTVRDGRSGLLVPVGEALAFGRALNQVLDDPALAKRMGIAARESVRGFSWDLVVKRSMTLYEDLVAGVSPPLAVRSS
ncbi:MAG TPA: glycosyltransferase [Chloroflexota bacterium]|nr:glycosyltransferase [Chloroflexota bacterium]